MGYRVGTIFFLQKMQDHKTYPLNHLYQREAAATAYHVYAYVRWRFAHTVRLLTHVLCKPTHFCFHSFIATMSYSLQTSFGSVMKDCADKYHAVHNLPHRAQVMTTI